MRVACICYIKHLHFVCKVDGSVKIDDLDRTVEELIDDCREPLIG